MTQREIDHKINDLRIIKKNGVQYCQLLAKIENQKDKTIFYWRDYLKVFCESNVSNEKCNYICIISLLHESARKWFSNDEKEIIKLKV